MKKSIVLLFWLAAGFTGYSQNLYFSPMLEKTVAGAQYGVLGIIQIKSRWGFGGFYQCSLLKRTDAVNARDSFFGLTVNAPMVRNEKLNVYVNARIGFADEQFFVIAPGLETELSISRHLSVSALMSMRMSYPSAGAKINIKLYK